MKRLLFALLLLPVPALAGTCPSPWLSIDVSGNPVSIVSAPGSSTGLGGAGTLSCFYASKSIGSDTLYDGTQETISGSHGPWAHVPGMPDCSGNCASHTPTPGDAFILKGGDTWSGSDVGIALNQYGTQANWIYYGVDLNWFTGPQWTRPILNMTSATSGNAFLFNNGASPAYIWIDNLEITGLNNTRNGCYAQGAQQLRCSQIYFHAWVHVDNVSPGVGSNNVGFFSQGGTGATADHNVIDGSDSIIAGPFEKCGTSLCATMNVAYGYWSVLSSNYIFGVVSGEIATADTVHDNEIYNTYPSVDGDHCNGFFTFNPLSFGRVEIYNNVVSLGNTCGGGVQLWMNGNGQPNSSFGGDSFNNVIVNNTGGNLIDVGNHGSGNYGTYQAFNNAVDCTNGGCAGALPLGPYFGMLDQNNVTFSAGGSGFYFPLDSIPSGGTSTPCVNGAGSGCNDIDPLISLVTGQGYAPASAAAPFSPPSSGCTSTANCATFQAGANLTSTCSAIADLNARAACLLGSGGGLVYNSSTHIVGPTATNYKKNPRPVSGPWDAGPYQFATSGPLPAATPVISPAAGTYNSTQSVTITDSTAGSYICVTTNGTTPVPNGVGGCLTGTLYSGAISVSTTTTVNAVADASGYTASAEASSLFTISTLPVVIQTATTGLSAESGSISLSNLRGGNDVVIIGAFLGTGKNLNATFSDSQGNTWLVPSFTNGLAANLALDGDTVVITCAPVNAGSDTISININGVAGTASMTAREVLNATCGLDGTPVSSNTTAQTQCNSGSLTTHGANDFLFGFCGIQHNQTLTVGSGWSNGANAGTGGNPDSLSESQVASAGSYTATSATYSTVAEQTTIIVPFTQAGSFTVVTSVSPSNAGTITGTCGGTFASGTSMSCQVNANAGFTFTGWTSGPCNGTTTNPCTFSLTSNQTATAGFSAVGESLTITPAGNGNGTISGTNCATGSYSSSTSIGPCTFTPATGSVLASVSGTGSAAGCTSSPCSFTITAPSTITPTFTLQTFTFSTTIVGSGSIVPSLPNGCIPGTFNYRTAFGCTALPAKGYAFAGWSGTLGSSSTNPLNFNLTQNVSLTATFIQVNPPSIQGLVTVQGLDKIQ